MLESGDTKKSGNGEIEGRHIKKGINFVMLVEVKEFICSRQNRTVVAPGA